MTDPKKKRAYLGDGAYACEGCYDGELLIYTSNGIVDENHVALDRWEGVPSLLRFISKLWNVKITVEPLDG